MGRLKALIEEGNRSVFAPRERSRTRIGYPRQNTHLLWSRRPLSDKSLRLRRMTTTFPRLLPIPLFCLIARRMSVRSKTSEDSFAEVEMYRSTTTRWIATPLLAAAIVAQSFAGVDSASCQCAGSEPGVGAATCGCCCSQGAREQGSCCCSKPGTRSASPGPSSAEAQATSASCCPAKTSARPYRCGCNHRPPEPVAPVNTGRVDVNRIQLLLSWFDVSFERTSIPRLGPESRHASVGHSVSSPSVQVLCCTWLT